MLARMSSPWLVIPHDSLSEAALEGVVEEYITREGTDYGHQEASLADKKARVMQQLERGDVVIVFDAKAQATSLVRRDALAKGGA